MSLRQLLKRAANKLPVAAALLDYARFRLSHMDFLSQYSSGDANLIAQIRRNGYVVLKDYVSTEFCSQCIRDIDVMFQRDRRHVQSYSDKRIFGAEELSAKVKHFAEDAFLAGMANHYMCAKTVNAFTLANIVESREGSMGSGEGWHKDASFRQFKAILYLNEVDENNGPFQLLHQSHTLGRYLGDMRSAQLPFRPLRINDAQLQDILRNDPARLRTITGKPGTLLLVDTASIHRGSPPKQGVRYALTNYYVENFQITPQFIKAYSPVSPEKVVMLRRNWK